jgi:hypothetical protein
MRSDIDLTVAAIRNPTFVTLSDGTIRNMYDLRLRNKHGETRPFRVTIKGDPALRVGLEGTPYQVVDVPADKSQIQRVYISAAPGSDVSIAPRADVRFWVEDISNGDRAYRDTVFNGTGAMQ